MKHVVRYIMCNNKKCIKRWNCAYSHYFDESDKDLVIPGLLFEESRRELQILACYDCDEGDD